MSIIHITDGQSDKILDYITAKNIIDNNHRQSLKDNLETFDFITFADKSFSAFLGKHNRVIIPAEDQGYQEFVIKEAGKTHGDSLEIEVFASASYLLLKKAKVMDPQTFTEQTATTLVSHTTNGTEWRPGIIEGKGFRTMHIEQHTNPYAFLKRLATEFGLELRFRVEVKGGKVVGRFVDLLERIGKWRGREIEFGRDLIGIRRIEKTDNVFTAVKGLGPEREDGTRLEVIVEDKEALQRWGRPDPITGELQHLWDTYEPQTTDQNMSLSRLKTLTENELEKRVNEVVEYESTIADLEHVPGMENKKIRFGDTIKIKDTKFNPPLYLEARVHTQDRSITDKSRKKVSLGDYIEYTEEQVQAIWKQLQKQINLKIDGAKLAEYTYDKVTIDSKDEVVFSDGKTFAQIRANEAQSAAEQYAITKAEAERVKAESYADGIVTAEEQARINDVNAKLMEAKQHADTTAAAAESAAKTHADLKANQAESNAKGHADTVSGQAEANAKAYAVAKTIYDAKMTEIAGDLADKAGLTYVDGQLVSKANKGDVYTISEVDNRLLNYVGVTKYQTDMDGIVTDLNSYGTRIGQNETAIGLKANQTEVDTLKGTVSDNSAQLNIQANQIASKVDATYVQGAIGDVEVGGRNLLPLSDFRPWGKGYSLSGYIFNLSQTSTTSGGAGIRLPNSNIEPQTQYVLSFKTKKISGSVTTIAGHSGYIEEGKGLYIDGNYVASTFSATYPDDSNIHEIVLHFISPSAIDDWLYIQPNRSHYDLVYEMEIWDIKLEKGNKATDWTPAPEDTQAQIDDNALIIEQHDTSITQLSNQITSKVETSVVNAIEGRVTANETTLTQYDTRINAKAESSTVDSLGVRMNTAETDIDGLNSTITLKADATVVGALEDRVSSAELTINGMESTISAKADRIELDGFVTATDLAVDGNLTFGGKLSGASGSFSGSVITDDGLGNKVEVDNGEIRTTKNGAPVAELSSNGLVLFQNNGEEVGSLRDSQYVTNNAMKGISLNTNKDYVNIGFGSAGSTTTPIFNAERTTRRVIIAGSDDVSWDGRLELRSSFVDANGDGYIPKVNVINYTDSSTRWGGIMAYVGRNNNAPGGAGERYGFEIWQYQGLGDGSAKQLFKVDKDEHRYYTQILDSLEIGYDVASDPRFRIRYDGTNGNTEFETLGTDRYWNKRITFKGRGGGEFEFSNDITINSSTGRFIGSDQVTLRAVLGRGYLQSPDEFRVTQPGTAATYKPIRASGFPTGSMAEYKQDIIPWEQSALDLINQATIYEYRLKDEVANGVWRQRQGLVIGEGYNTPSQVIDGDGVEQYLMNSWSWKAIQELSIITTDHEERINFLEMENQQLKAEIKQLKGVA
ncbi:phage tail spike protein [Virgibacillus halodenitrificans]|uniref:phage tail spike protein n=1 Tax=Virgibacillus halodenitrificans TaxID=1482 RepID=UPI0002DDDBFE|nr:phage tail spike protein [Virgibacillus halodenitrificans]